MNTLQFSFELISSTNDREIINMIETARKLDQLKPSLFTLANRLDHLTPKQHFDSARAINQLDLSLVAPTLTYNSVTKESAYELLERYKAEGIYNLIIRQGVENLEDGPSDFEASHELIRYIKDEFGHFFTLYSSAYPDIHHQSPNAEVDIDRTVEKVQAGASSLIAQFCFNIEAFLFMRDQLVKRGCFATVIPSIMPITQPDALRNIAKHCHVDIPHWLDRHLASREENPKALRDFSFEITLNLCRRLMSEGVTHFHFHTFNEPSEIAEIIHLLTNQ